MMLMMVGEGDGDGVGVGDGKCHGHRHCDDDDDYCGCSDECSDGTGFVCGGRVVVVGVTRVVGVFVGVEEVFVLLGGVFLESCF